MVLHQKWTEGSPGKAFLEYICVGEATHLNYIRTEEVARIAGQPIVKGALDL